MPFDKIKRGFTLVEVVVIVAIIGLLSALIFPVFARARSQARRATCLSHLKQIGLGTMQYTQDAAGRFPTGNAFWDKTLPDRYLANVMKPYVQINVWDCPAWQARYSKDDAHSPGNYSYITTPNGVIGYSKILGFTKRSSSVLRLRRPATYPLFFCGSGPLQGDDVSTINAHSLVSDKIWEEQGKRLVGGTSILYGDLHAKYVAMDRSQFDQMYSTVP